MVLFTLLTFFLGKVCVGTVCWGKKFLPPEETWKVMYSFGVCLSHAWTTKLENDSSYAFQTNDQNKNKNIKLYNNIYEMLTTFWPVRITLLNFFVSLLRILLHPFFRWETWGLARLYNLFHIPQLLRSKVQYLFDEGGLYRPYLQTLHYLLWYSSPQG